MSSSTALTRANFISWHLSAASLRISSTFSLPLLLAVRLLTIDESEAPKAPASAAIEPPPGAGDSRETSSIKSVTFISTKAESKFLGSPKTLSSILNSDTSFNPSDCTAVFKISFTGTPVDLPCFFR